LEAIVLSVKQKANKKTVNSINISLIAIWTALLLSVSFLIIYPIHGVGVTITLSSVLLNSLTAPLLGPIFGTASGLIFGLAVPIVNPSTSIGGLTFLAPTIAALMGGLVLFNRWKEALLILVIQLVVCFAHPFAWYQQMPIITWAYWLTLLIIFLPPIRKWILNTIVNRNEKYLPIIRHGKKQTVETLINEEALLLAKFLRKERKHWNPRLPNIN
jgi:hypothetical protein